MDSNSSPNKLLRKLLGFKELSITGFKMMPLKGILHIYVKPYKNGGRCPECHRRCKLLCGGKKSGKRRMRTWRDTPVAGLAVALHYAPREILCPTHGRRQETIPWAAANARATLRLEYQLMRLCKTGTQKDAAAALGLPASTAAETLHRVVRRCREGYKVHGLKNLGIDEISYKKGHRYLTLVYDLDRSHIIWAGKGKGRDTIDRFFREHMSPGQRARVKTACCDMSKTYTGAIAHHLPGALLVLDRFHVVKALNEALDTVRREESRASPGPWSKHIRFALLKNASNRTATERKTLGTLAKSSRRLHRAIVLKDELSHFWEYKHLGNAEKFLKKWKKKAKLSRIEPLRKFARTLENHWDGVIASLTGVTNAVAEGINRVVRMTKNRASGYRNTDNFINMIYLVKGGRDLPAQIPVKNRPRETKRHAQGQLAA